MSNPIKTIESDIRDTALRTHVTSICMSLGLVLVGVGLGLKWGGVIVSRHLMTDGQLSMPMQSAIATLNGRIQLAVYGGMVALVIAVYLQTNE